MKHAIEPTNDDVRHEPNRLSTRIVRTTLGWAAIYLLLLALFAVLGDELEGLAIWTRLLIISGVMVTLMVNVIMPLIGVVLKKW